MFDIQEYKKNNDLDKCYLNMLDNINNKLTKDTLITAQVLKKRLTIYPEILKKEW